MPDAVEEKVISAIADLKKVSPDTIAPDASLAELEIDSLDVVTLVFELEDEFQVSVPDDKIRSVRSVRDVIDGIRLLQEAKADASQAAS
jgi:acyl carrier protein